MFRLSRGLCIRPAAGRSDVLLRGHHLPAVHSLLVSSMSLCTMAVPDYWCQAVRLMGSAAHSQPKHINVVSS